VGEDDEVEDEAGLGVAEAGLGLLATGVDEVLDEALAVDLEVVVDL
jgi:hypothetical protein